MPTVRGEHSFEKKQTRNENLGPPTVPPDFLIKSDSTCNIYQCYGATFCTGADMELLMRRAKFRCHFPYSIVRPVPRNSTIFKELADTAHDAFNFVPSCSKQTQDSEDPEARGSSGPEGAGRQRLLLGSVFMAS